jgi:5'(3')-deoxyribonucleotidase
MKIALDVDSVLADVIVTWLDVYREFSGHSLMKTEVNTWNFWRNLDLTRKQFEDIFTESWCRWEQIPPTENNLAGTVKHLRQLHTVDIVTGRTLNTVPDVKKWLSWQNIAYEQFVRVPAYTLKSNLEYDVFIDDSPYNVMGAAFKNRYSILYDQPWNQDVEPHPSIFRVKNLLEALEIVEKLVPQES